MSGTITLLAIAAVVICSIAAIVKSDYPDQW
jgi:hypothetical protein